MTDRAKQIEEMAKELSPYGSCKITICENCNRKKNSKCTYYSFAKRYTIKGYRKQSEVAKEFVDRLILELIALRSEEFDGKELAINGKTYKYLVMRAKEIAAEYGVEVEK